jgi:hypothetical protein
VAAGGVWPDAGLQTSNAASNAEPMANVPVVLRFITFSSTESLFSRLKAHSF